MGKEYIVDESKLLDSVDELLINMDLSVLERAREECIKNNESTEMLDKIIKEKRDRDGLNKKEDNRVSILSDLFKNRKKGNNETENNSEYEPYNFEEEVLEEDDYYHDDLD